MLPLSLLKTAQNHPMLVELKNGETYNGHLVSCDNWMNINLREVICTSRSDGVLSRMETSSEDARMLHPWQHHQVLLRIPDEIIDMVKEEVVSKGRGRANAAAEAAEGALDRQQGAGVFAVMSVLTYPEWPRTARKEAGRQPAKQ
uniref:RNA processing protein n=1 Tax=Sphaerodactylus townsendi TaxID=933632 RepID=A0ACB8F1K9_9SAUR